MYFRNFKIVRMMNKERHTIVHLGFDVYVYLSVDRLERTLMLFLILLVCEIICFLVCFQWTCWYKFCVYLFLFPLTCYCSVEIDGSLADLDGRLESGSKKRYEPLLLPFNLFCLDKIILLLPSTQHVELKERSAFCL